MSTSASQRQPTHDEAFGARVRDFRLLRGMSQGEVAAEMRRLGHSVHQTTVGKIEAGHRAVRLTEAIALSRLLRVPLQDLVFGDPRGEALLLALVQAESDYERWTAAQAQAQRALTEATVRIEEAAAARRAASDAVTTWTARAEDGRHGQER